jgi:type IV secretory pathway VirB10-like protein
MGLASLFEGATPMDMGRTTLGVVAVVAVAAGLGGIYIATRGEEPGPSGDTSNVEVTQTEETIEPAPLVEPPPAPRRAAPRRPAAAQPPPARPQPVADAVEVPPPPVADVYPSTPPSAPPEAAIEPEPRAEEPPAPELVDLVVPADAVVGLQIETSLTSETARVEDSVAARVTRDVRVGDRVAIPSGARAHGEVTLVERGGRLRERARLGVRFTSVVLADGTRVPLEAETVYREGEAPGGESAAKIGGGGIGGAIIGGILGGARGAAIGGSIGAGAGTAAVLAGGRNPATLAGGTPVTVRLVAPTTVTVER